MNDKRKTQSPTEMDEINTKAKWLEYKRLALKMFEPPYGVVKDTPPDKSHD